MKKMIFIVWCICLVFSRMPIVMASLTNAKKYEVIPFDGNNTDIKRQLCSIVAEDEEIKKNIWQPMGLTDSYLSVNETTNILVCKSTNEIPIVYGFIKYSTCNRGACVGSILGLAVHKDHRRQGFARALLSKSEQKCKDSNLRGLWSYVNVNDEISKKLHEEYGFKSDDLVHDELGGYTMKKLFKVSM
jgi:ribosomal protein S18 acetylase RimI-like enzyme